MLQVWVWMNMPSGHQADLFRALVDSGEVDLQVIFARHLVNDRVQLGWEENLYGFTHFFLDARNRVIDAARIAWRERGRFHIVNGIWAEPAFASALAVLALVGSRYVIYSEAPDPSVERSASKQLLRSAFGRAIVKRATGALSVSRLAEEYYVNMGLHEQTLYPFGYFRKGVNGADLRSPWKNQQRAEVVFVGQFIRRKGIDLLLGAMLPLFDDSPDLVLSLIGAGEMEAELRTSVERLGLTGRVVFQGVTPLEKIPARIASADLLVLPSRWDGWGMVVNEALSVGVPVIVSDRCGAADLIQHGINGYVFRSEDVEDLRRCLRGFLEDADNRLGFRSEAASTGRAVSTEAAAPYLLDCLKHMTGESNAKPAPPWLPHPSQSVRH